MSVNEASALLRDADIIIQTLWVCLISFLIKKTTIHTSLN